MGRAQQYRAVCDDVAAQCRAVGRDPHDVKVVAVSKTVGVAEVAQVVEAGAHDFGENRPDGLSEKATAFPRETWHFIGNVQSRRIPEIVRSASLVHSLYQEHHVSRFDAAAEAMGKVQDVLLEVNVSGERQKSGLAPDDLPALLEHCGRYSHVRVCGLMTMAPQGDPAAARSCFEDLARLRDELRGKLDAERADVFNELSMGMSEDWREAVVAGATIVRIGRAIFDETFEGALR